MTFEFLEPDEVLEIHAAQLEAFGGPPGVRDRGLLESALAPQATAFGEYLHRRLRQVVLRRGKR